MLGLAVLVTGCMTFTYDELTTPLPYVVPSQTGSPTALPTITPTSQQGDTQDEASPTPPVIHGPLVLRVDPPVLNLAVGETQLVRIWLDNVEQLHSIELHIGFEPQYVHIEDADPNEAGVQIGAGVIPVPAQVVRNEVDHDAGLIVYHVEQAPGTPVSGSGMVASFVARALVEGGSPLSFDSVTLRDPEAQLLPPPEQIDGLVLIGEGAVGGADGAMPAPTVVGPSSTSPTPESPAPVGGTHHTVQPGENLFRIALHYGTTVDAIVAANNLSDPGSIQVGQELIIPAGSPTSADTYVVQPGDTLYSIARRCNMTVETLATLNGITPPYTIAVGQVLTVKR